MSNSKVKTEHKLTELHVATLGVGGIVFLEALALAKGIDGIMFGSAMAGIGGVIGWVFKDFYKAREKHHQHRK